MSIVKMKKLTLIALESEREKLLESLLLLGCVEVSDNVQPIDDPVITRCYIGGTEKPKTDRTSILSAVEILDSYAAPAKTRLFYPGPDIDALDFLSDRRLEQYLSAAKDIDEAAAGIRSINSDIARETALLESLKPWESYDLPLEYEGTATASVIIGAVPSTVIIAQLQADLTNAVPESQIYEVAEDALQRYICVICLRGKQSETLEVLRAYSFTVSQLKSRSGTAHENIDGANRRITKLSAEREALEARICSYAELRSDMLCGTDLLQTQIERTEASDKLLATERTVILNGWVTVPEVPELERALSEYSCSWELSDPVPDEYPDVPVKLKNNVITEPLNMVTEMYSLPAYDGVDPNPVMAPFFVLFYGAMMADVGYGLIMTIAALIVNSKKPRGGTKHFFGLMLLCGISTIVFGILTGGFFGDAPTQIGTILTHNPDYVFNLPYKPLFDPITDTMTVLIGAMVVGFIHIVFGMGISFVKQCKDGHVLDAIFDVGSWWVVFAGLALGALGITWIVAIVGAAMIVLTQGRSTKNFFGKIANGLGALYNITGYLSDVLSYARLMALMLAGSVIAKVFNTIGAMMGNIFVFIIVFLIGHALNLGLNLLGCYVHDLRLQFLEFFGKFYQDGGRPFAPLSIKAKYTNIIK